MPFSNPTKKLEYQREWYAARRLKGIELLGGKCAQCGATEDLELDHIDPATKFTHRIWSYSWVRINEELAKCQLLCVPCHFQKTLAFISTAGGMWATRKNHHKKGCGCQSCCAMRSAEIYVVLQNKQQIKSPDSDQITRQEIEAEVWN
jgi:5-methylcytosine-specific restriction endonuclease McrA